MTKQLSDYRGAVDKCACRNPIEPEDCKICLCRGYIAECLNCGGTGQTTVPVAGSTQGTMRSTCAPCAGKGTFPANKPTETQQAA